MSKPLVSVIILNLNGGKITLNCLKSVLASKFSNFEVILIDNGSLPTEVEQLKKIRDKKLRVVINKNNLGYAAGNNLGAKLARGEFLVFLNNDTLVSPTWLIEPINILKNNPHIAFLQPKIKSARDQNFFEYAGGAGGYLDIFGYPFVRGRIFGSIEEDVGQYDDEREVFWASGVALFCRKEIFQQLHGFDHLFFAYAEENDLCFRAHRAGYQVFYFPGETIFHLGGYTSNRNISQKIFLIHRNHLILLIKNLKLLQLAYILPIRLFFDWGSLLYYCFLYRSLKIPLTVVKSYCSLLKHLPKILKSREKLEYFGYPHKKNLVYKGSIVIQYFLFNRRRWSDLMGEKSKRDLISSNYTKAKIKKIF